MKAESLYKNVNEKENEWIAMDHLDEKLHEHKKN